MACMPLRRSPSSVENGTLYLCALRCTSLPLICSSISGTTFHRRSADVATYLVDMAQRLGAKFGVVSIYIRVNTRLMALVIILWLCNLCFTPADARQLDGMWEIPMWVVIVVVVFMKVVLYDITHIATFYKKKTWTDWLSLLLSIILKILTCRRQIFRSIV